MKPRRTNVETWTIFLRRCFHQRVGPEKFESYVKILDSNSAISPDHLCDLLLPEHDTYHHASDPLLPLFAERLLSLELLSTYHVLQILLNRRRSTEVLDIGNEAVQKVAKDILTRSDFEQSLIGCVARVMSSPELRESRSCIRQTLSCVSDWLQHLTRQNVDMVIQSASSSVPDVAQAIYAVRENLAAVLVIYLCRKEVADVSKAVYMSDTLKKLAGSITAFIPVIAATHMSLATRIHMIQKDIPALQPIDTSETTGATPRNGSSRIEPGTVSELQQVNTRANFYIYLGNLLSYPCTYNDRMLLGYMHTRYAGDTASAIMGMILAAFDVLASSTAERRHTFVARSFLTARVPSLIVAYASLSFVPMQLSVLISQALNQVDQSGFPIRAHVFEPDSGGTEHWDPRNALLTACLAHGVINETDFEQMLGEKIPHTGSGLKRLDRNALTADCKRDNGKLEQLAKHVSEIDANAAFRAEALIEGMHTRVANKDKSTLGRVARQLGLDDDKLDAIALHCSPVKFLQALCQTMLDWQREDGGSSKRVDYEDYGACLFLLLRMSDRYNLSPSDLEVAADDTSLSPLIERRSEPLDVTTFSRDQGLYFAAWIKALFDDKTIGDGVLGSCPVGAFYKLIPTIFQQTVIACQANAVDIKTLKSAMDLILDDFLLPALIPGLRWLAANIQPESSETGILVVMLTHLARAGATAGEEATAMHSALVKVVGPEMLIALNRLTTNGEAAQEIVSLYHSISSQQLNGEGSFCITSAELQRWTVPQRGSMIAAFRAAFKNLCYWSSHSTMAATKSLLTHAQLHALVQSAGAALVLNALVEETKSLINGGMGEVALDVATSIIYSASTKSSLASRADGEAAKKSSDGRLTMQDVLNIAIQNPASLATADTVKAETYVRLHRRSSGLLAALVAAAETAMPMDMPTTEDIMADINLDVGDDAGHNTMDFGHDGAGDLHLPELETSLPNGKSNAAANVDVSDPFASMTGHDQFTSTDDDIFGGLDLDESMQLNF